MAGIRLVAIGNTDAYECGDKERCPLPHEQQLNTSQRRMKKQGFA